MHEALGLLSVTAPLNKGVTFVRTDEPGPMHEIAINLFVSDGADYLDVLGSAVLVGPELALTTRHNVEIFHERFERARSRGEARGEMQLLGVQTWLEPAATIVHRVSKWFAAPWTDLAVLRLSPAGDQLEERPSNYRWRAVKLDLIPPPVGAAIATFGFDDVQVTRTEEALAIRARGVTSTGVVVEVLHAILGNAHHGWPRFQTNARFDGGMSGGPVMRDGLACGVVSTSLPATSDDEEHASFVPLLWPAMAIEIDDPRSSDSRTVTLLELAESGVIAAKGHESVLLVRNDEGKVMSVGFKSSGG
jgi:hypothetical protein